jgi:hypothetical protein
MFTIIFLALAAIAATGLIILKKRSGTADILDAIVTSMMFFNVGLGGIFAFVGHAFMADRIAARIGWPAGSPFQFEVAVANLAFGVIGLISARLKGDFRFAVASGYAVFLVGAGVGHIRQIISKGNFSEYNAGVFLFIGDLFIPILLLVLVLVHRKLTDRV